MSYYVIKGPRVCGQYLCVMPGRACPQWWYKRSDAIRFPDEDGAYKFLRMTQQRYESEGCDYTGRVVRVNTLRDWKAERARLIAEIERLRTAAPTTKEPR